MDESDSTFDNFASLLLTAHVVIFFKLLAYFSMIKLTPIYGYRVASDQGCKSMLSIGGMIPQN